MDLSYFCDCDQWLPAGVVARAGRFRILHRALACAYGPVSCRGAFLMSVSREVTAQNGVWRTATWSAPLLTQVILGLVLVIAWWVGKWYPGTSGLVLLLIGAGALFLVCASLSGLLMRSTSPSAQGVAFGLIGSYAIVVVGGAIYGFWILQW